jgi:hypothetical protein
MKPLVFSLTLDFSLRGKGSLFFLLVRLNPRPSLSLRVPVLLLFGGAERGAWWDAWLGGAFLGATDDRLTRLRLLSESDVLTY